MATNLGPCWSRRKFIQSLTATLVLSSDGPRQLLYAAGATQPATAPVSDGNRLTGKVVFEGEAPEREKLDLRMDPFCARLYRKEPLLSEDLIVDEQGGLANVFVSMTRGLPDREWPIPEEPVVLEERCRFIPHVFGVRAGQKLRIVNESEGTEVPHLHGRKNPNISFTLPRKGMSRDVVLHETEVVSVTCDVHPWEQAWCHVVDHPFFAVTDEKGRFAMALDGIEPGSYELTFWHEKLGTRAIAPLHIGKASIPDVKTSFTMPDPRDRGRGRRRQRPE